MAPAANALRSFLFLVAAAGIAGGCASYKQNLMLKTPEDFTSAKLSKEVLEAERNYVIQKNDLLRLEVYANKGERIIDPNPDLSQRGNPNTVDEEPQEKYLVDLQGIAKFPVIGEVKVEGLTLRQAESLLQSEYEKYFKESFVLLTFVNKRVVILGAVGGHVVPLENHNVTLVEILAVAKGLPNDSKANNIRIVRKDQVFVVDLSTVDGFLAGNMIVEPGDIIYVEPVRKPFAEGLRDYAGLASLLISTLSLIIVIQSTK
ncbi:MAG: polysaccharide biosynthesis/export family protein [Cyclobacteriaceae bacterium]|nr:polysaccharide biosynthesis/export family protein [Cyclobacteriaceae bacterium]